MPISSMLCQLMDEADGHYELARQRYPDIEEIFDTLKATKKLGCFHMNDEWELKYSAILCLLAINDLAVVATKGELTPEGAADLWLDVRRKFFTRLGVVDYDSLVALGETFIPAESYWLTVLNTNYGEEFGQAFMEAKTELAKQVIEEDD